MVCGAGSMTASVRGHLTFEAENASCKMHAVSSRDGFRARADVGRKVAARPDRTLAEASFELASAIFRLVVYLQLEVGLSVRFMTRTRREFPDQSCLLHGVLAASKASEYLIQKLVGSSDSGRGRSSWSGVHGCSWSIDDNSGG
jgi:hypothetical protein